jgi:hypothetical protein
MRSRSPHVARRRRIARQRDAMESTCNLKTFRNRWAFDLGQHLKCSSLRVIAVEINSHVKLAIRKCATYPQNFRCWKSTRRWRRRQRPACGVLELYSGRYTQTGYSKFDGGTLAQRKKIPLCSSGRANPLPNIQFHTRRQFWRRMLIEPQLSRSFHTIVPYRRPDSRRLFQRLTDIIDQ